VLAYACSGLAWIGLFMVLLAITSVVVNQWFPKTATAPSWTRTYTWPRIVLHPQITLDLLMGNWRDFISYPINSALHVALLAATLYLCFIWWWRFLWVSLRRFLRFDQTNAMALFLSTQLIGLLSVVILLSRNDPLATLIGRVLLRLF
jgi:hypothetical protein